MNNNENNYADTVYRILLNYFFEDEGMQTKMDMMRFSCSALSILEYSMESYPYLFARSLSNYYIYDPSYFRD